MWEVKYWNGVEWVILATFMYCHNAAEWSISQNLNRNVSDILVYPPKDSEIQECVWFEGAIK